MSGIKEGDFVDVRMVAVAINDRGDVVVRHPDARAVHQFTVAAHQVQHYEPRSPEAIAADVVCASYGSVAPLQRRGSNGHR